MLSCLDSQSPICAFGYSLYSLQFSPHCTRWNISSESADEIPEGSTVSVEWQFEGTTIVVTVFRSGVPVVD